MLLARWGSSQARGDRGSSSPAGARSLRTRARRSTYGWRVTGLLAALALGCAEPEALPLSGVLITIDTTNPGALDLYGESRGITPELERLAQRSIVYDRAHTVAPITLPAHVSMMTGLYPLRHGVRDNGWARLSGEAETLAERAQERGYATAAFVSAVVLGAPYGLDQGFERYSEPSSGASGALSHIDQRDSKTVTDEALAWLAERDEDRPFLLWVHYFDPHMPYGAPERFLDQAGGQPYLAEVAAMDHDIGRLVTALDQSVGADGYLLAVVADHGESFGRHGEPTHSAYAYQATIHVPFLLRYPDGRGAGTRSARLVSVVDLFPTFVDALGLGSPGPVDGLSLASPEPTTSRGVYVESYSGYLNYGWSPLAGWIDERGKYLHSSAPEFYDLESDPKEARDLLASTPVDVSEHRAALERLARLPRLRSSGVELDEERLAELRALGYAAAGGEVRELPGPLEPSERVAPRTRSAQYAQFSKALGLAQAGRNPAAIRILREILAENAANVFAAETLASCLLQEQSFDEVIAVLAPRAGADRYATHAYLATAYENLRRDDEALVHYRAALRLRPSEPTLIEAIDRVKANLGG